MDIVLGDRTRCRRIVGTDGSTELGQLPAINFTKVIFKGMIQAV